MKSVLTKIVIARQQFMYATCTIPNIVYLGCATLAELYAEMEPHMDGYRELFRRDILMGMRIERAAKDDYIGVHYEPSQDSPTGD